MHLRYWLCLTPYACVAGRLFGCNGICLAAWHWVVGAKCD